MADKQATGIAAFSRDLGYLDKFLASLRSHAEGLSEPQRSELLGLLAEEDSRWARLKGLLSGESRSSAPVAASAPVEAKPATNPRSETRTGWTIGSMMPGR